VELVINIVRAKKEANDTMSLGLMGNRRGAMAGSILRETVRPQILSGSCQNTLPSHLNSVKIPENSKRSVVIQSQVLR
jgi:hypothetical protein